MGLLRIQILRRGWGWKGGAVQRRLHGIRKENTRIRPNGQRYVGSRTYAAEEAG